MERIERERPIYQNMAHDQLANAALCLDAFGQRLRIVEMVRHPVDLVDSWLRRGLGTRFGYDPLMLTFCVEYQGQDVPYYARGWESQYVTATPAGRVLQMIARLWDDNQQAYASLSPASQCQQVFFVPFERFVQQPCSYVRALAAFLETAPTRKTPHALTHQRCPRSYRVEDRVERWKRLVAQLSGQEQTLLQRLAEEYDAVVRQVACESAGEKS